ncbi:MAG: hypothetical protein PHU31_07315 [Anaerotignum sp.]|nr:hypothetical protein [Anaerotignum sp.]
MKKFSNQDGTDLVEVNRKNIVGLPYSLHDARVNKIKIEAEKIVISFHYGFFEPTNGDLLSVKGNVAISITGFDLDFCVVYLMDCWKDFGKFTGEKLSLEEFINRFPAIDFEIIDETYGYNQSKFSGYLYTKKEMKECFIEIYHFGDMKYILED